MSNTDLNFYIRDDGIMVFKFYALHRAAADQFAKVVQSGMQNVPPKLRIVYDFSMAPPPTPYFNKIQSTLYNEFPHPDDEKSAYVTGTAHNEVWVRIVRGYITPKDTHRIFTEFDAAIAWLQD